MKNIKKIISLILVTGLLMQSVSVFGGVASTSAKPENEKPVLSVEQATRKAISNSSAIKNALDSESLGDENIRKATDALYGTVTNMALVGAEIGLMNAEMSRALNLQDIDAQKQNVEYQITKYFNTIISAEKDVLLFDESLEIVRKDLAIANLKLTLGMISRLDYDLAALDYDKVVNARQTKLSAIDSAYRDLNSYMGENLDKRFTLQLNLTFKEVGDINLNSYADEFVKNSLTIKQIENAAKLAEYSVDNYSTPFNPMTGEIIDNASVRSYEELVVSQNQALRALADTKKAVRDAVIATYSGLKDMEIGIKVNEIDLEKAKMQLVVMEKMLELGQVTKLDVAKLEYDINSKELALEKSKNSYTLTLAAFSNPNLLLGMAASGGSSAGGADSSGGASGSAASSGAGQSGQR